MRWMACHSISYWQRATNFITTNAPVGNSSSSKRIISEGFLRNVSFPILDTPSNNSTPANWIHSTFSTVFRLAVAELLPTSLLLIYPSIIQVFFVRLSPTIDKIRMKNGFENCHLSGRIINKWSFPIPIKIPISNKCGNVLGGEYEGTVFLLCASPTSTGDPSQRVSHFNCKFIGKRRKLCPLLFNSWNRHSIVNESDS